MSDPNTAVTVASAAIGFLLYGLDGVAVAIIGYVTFMFVATYFANR